MSYANHVHFIFLICIWFVSKMVESIARGLIQRRDSFIEELNFNN